MIQTQSINSANRQPSYTSPSGQKCMQLDPSVDTGAPSAVIYVMLRQSEIFCYTQPVISLSWLHELSATYLRSHANSGVLNPKISSKLTLTWFSLTHTLWSSGAPIC